MIKTTVPSSPILQKYIECFYFYEGEANSKFSYWAFPHYNTGLSFFRGVSIERKDWTIQISENPKAAIHIELLGKYTNPLLIEYRGKIQEISIVFKPLGLNRFLRDHYLSIAPKYSQEFINNEWLHFGASLFSNQGDIVSLEKFLLNQFSDNQEFVPIESSIEILGRTNDETSISDIASMVGYNLKTFQRHFKKHIGCTPVEYRRICRFRNSLSYKLNSTQLKNLTEITYESGYFDQSYFIKEFRKLTNHNPKEFFRAASKVDGDKLVWVIK